MSRFSVDQKILAFGFIRPSNPRSVHSAFILPYTYFSNTDKEIEKELVKHHVVTVTEAHKVRWDFDSPTDEPTYDGYSLKDEQNRIWHNQFPCASYGQISDAADYYFTLHVHSFEKPVRDVFDQMEKDLLPTKLVEAGQAYDAMVRGLASLPDSLIKTRLAESIADMEAVAKATGFEFVLTTPIDHLPDFTIWKCNFKE